MAILGVICLFSAISFMAPMVSGICHIGMIWPSVLLLLVSFRCFFPRVFKKIPYKLVKIGNALIALWLTFSLVISTFMAYYAFCHPPKDLADATVVVLGCQVYDGRPSIMLQSRIDVAYQYLIAHPDSYCIASGGMDDEETITEAQCIFETLCQMGIPAERIYLEDSSTSTYTNILNTSSLISSLGLSKNIVIATDNFHEMRAAIFAYRSGLEAYSIGAHSYPLLAPGYWCREIVGILALFIRGY